MGLKDYLTIIRRRWLSIVIITLVGGVAAAAFTALQTPMYSSSARLFVSTSDTDSAALFQGSQFSAQRVKSYADLISSRELADRVIDDLDLDTDASELSDQAEATVGVDTVNLTVSVTNPDPHDAQRIAQAYAEQLVDLVRELETPPGEREAPIKATIVDSASFSEAPVAPRPLRNIGLGLALGALLGAGVAVLREVLNTRVRSAEDLEGITEAPTLGAIVYDSSTSKTPLLTQVPAQSPRAESFRVLRTNLQFVDVDTRRKVIVVTSAVPEEGKTTTSVNLAISLAQGGARTLLMECDLRRPKAAERLALDRATGVTGILLGRVKTGDAVQVDESTGLHVLAAGAIPPNPAELLQSQAMVQLLTTLRADYDFVVIDAPPLLPVTDAALLAASADGALLVLSHGKVTRDQVAASITRLEQVDAKLVGLVMNKVPGKGKTYGYGYGYSNAHGYAPQQGRRRRQ